ncbi:hypothetical protein [Silvibacterium dinghuense]|uniref:hypothetical protein n=1 Tax=Silvibacterium dinghuense TaxID=1560006 RepID=UPI0013E94797|nr:hypothetical protein [Silvibacterium dinghuense]
MSRQPFQHGDASSGPRPSDAGNAHAEGPGGGGPHPPGSSRSTSNTVDWSRFFSSMMQSTVRSALPRAGAGGNFGTAPGLAQETGSGMDADTMGSSGMGGMQSGGFSGGAGAGGLSSGSGGGAGGGMGGAPGGGGQSGMGRMNMFSLGNNALRSLADSTGGALGESFSMLSRGSSLAGPGMSTSMKAGGLNLNLSGSLQGLWGGGMAQGGGQGGGSGGQNMFGSNGGSGMGGPGGGGHGGGGPGLGLALHMKF